MTTKKTESFQVNFVADVHLINVLGEQLIGSEKVGVLELIKNAYDAGATQCDIRIEKVPGLPEVEPSDSQVAELPGPVITIIDNGGGMDEGTIRNGWLRPATRIKTSVKERLKREREEADRRETRDEYEHLVAALKLEHGGRIPLGEKGVGRFATHRLGRYLTLQTKSRNEPYEWILKIDWNDFIPPDEKPLDLQKIDLTLVRREPQYDYGPTNSGTILRIYGGREGFEWTQETLREVGQAIALLRSPTKTREPARFKVEFHCPQLAGENFEVLTETIPAPFLCTALVDEKGKAEIEICLIPPSSLTVPLPAQEWHYTEDLREFPPEDKPIYWRTNGPRSPLRHPQCGPFTLEIKFWYRVREWIDGPDWRQFTKFLDQFGGIGIYRDGLSIVPAQLTSKTDWLRLSTRHIKKGLKISYYEMSGNVDLVQEDTLNLMDRTSREGMLETQAFHDLSELVRVIIILFENQVQETRDRHKKLKQGPQVSLDELNKRTQAVSQVLERISSHYNFKTDELSLADVVDTEQDPQEAIKTSAETLKELLRRAETFQEQLEALMEAAGYGIAIAVAVHEIEKITSSLYFGLEQLCKKTASLRDHTIYDESKELNQTAQSLLNELKRLAPLRVTRLERRRMFSVRDAVLSGSGAFRLTWKDLNIGFFPPTKENDFEMFGSFGACSQVFANLFDNSTYWLRSMESDIRHISVQMNPDKRQVIVADNGPGIHENIRPSLFGLFHSLKNPPSGLGLYICRYYMRQMKGDIRESSQAEKLPGFSGAHFTLTFPKLEKEE